MWKLVADGGLPLGNAISGGAAAFSEGSCNTATQNRPTLDSWELRMSGSTRQPSNCSIASLSLRAPSTSER